jgi:proline iminopeptidase
LTESRTRAEQAGAALAGSLALLAEDAWVTGLLLLVPGRLDADVIARIVGRGYDAGLLDDGLRVLRARFLPDVLLLDTHAGMTNETMVALAAVTTTSRDEVDWITESIGRIFPREWDAFAHASGRRTGQRVVDAYFERLTDPDDEVRDAAAAAWCAWEDVHVSLDPHATPDPRYQDRDFRNRFATHVVTSWAHSAFLGDRGVLDHIERIAHLSVVLIHGRLDVSSPLSTAWELHQALPLSQLVVMESEGHGGAGMTEALEAAYEKLLGDWAR